MSAPARDPVLSALPGEMAARLRAFDWSRNPLGPVDEWPVSLKTTVTTLLGSRFPMRVWWGPELINIYNDAYIPLLGNRHPSAFGQSAKVVWADLWERIASQVDAVFEYRQSTWNDRVPLPMDRSGRIEDAWFTWSYSPVYDESGSVAGLLCVAVENTQAVLAERERDRQTDLRQQSLDAARMGWWNFDPVARVGTWDERYMAMHGIDQKRLPYDEIIKHVHPDDRARIEEATARALDPTKPEPFSEQYRVVLRNGDVRWLHSHGLAHFEGEGSDRRATQFAGTTSDVTELRRADSAARTILESISDAFFAVDRDWRFTYVNSQAERLLDRRPGELIGKNLWEAYPELAGTPFEQCYRRVAAERVTDSITAYYPDHDRWYEVHVYPAPEGISVYFRDVTEAQQTRAVLLASQELVRASEERYRSVVAATTAIVWNTPASGEFDTEQPAWSKFTGQTFEQFEGWGWLDAVHPDDRAKTADTWRNAVVSRTLYSVEHRLRRHDGVYRHMIARATPILNSDGTVREWMGIHTDITEQKLAEQTLRESEERFRSFADTAPAMLWTTDPDGSCSFVSRGWSEFTGQSYSEALGHGWVDAVHPDEREAAQNAFLEANSRQEEFSLEHRLRRADGEYRWVIDAGRPRFDSSGNFLGYIGSVFDVHERRLTAEALEISRERLELVVHSSQVGLWYCDLPFDKLDWNFQVKEHFGLPHDAEVTLEQFYERLHPDDRPRTAQAVARAINERAEYDIEFRTIGLDGQQRWIHSIGRVTFAGETPIRFDGITLDVTERRRQEDALREADRRKDEFLATLAHELRNPLAPLSHGLEIMRLAAGDQELVEESREIMQRQLAYMVRLIDDLLDLSRISQGKIELRTERVDMAQIIHMATEIARPLVEQAGHLLKVDLPDETVLVEADVTRLAQVFGNLLNNAARYTEPGGQIGVKVTRDGRTVQVVVEDTGVGIPSEMLPRVFDMFTQVDRSLEKTRGGLGIGLTLVKRLVELHGGSVVAESDGEGRGSRFVTCLPVALAVVSSKPNAGGERASLGPGLRVLVVDDDRDAALSLARMLQLMGNETQIAYDGLEAVERAARFRPNLVLLDIAMPRLNGYDTARRLREMFPSVSPLIVALTGWGQEEDRRRSFEAGFDAHLVKPVDRAALDPLLERAKQARA